MIRWDGCFTLSREYNEMDAYNTPDELIYQFQPDIPITCFRPEALARAGRWFVQNFPGKVLYAVKANPAPYILSGLFDAGVRHFDTASFSEVHLVHGLCSGAEMHFMH